MKNIVQTFIGLFTLALSITLYSCNTAADEYLTDSGSVIVEGEMASLTFGIGEDMFTDITSRSAFKCDTVVQSLGDSLMVETIISPDYGLLTRAAKAVRNGVKILVVAYSQTQDKYIKREVATVNAGKFTIHLPAQETYDLIFYAVNDPTGIDLSTDAGYFTGTWTPGGEGESSALAGEGAGLKAKNGETTRDLMWTKATVNASSNATLPSISMKHLFCCANIMVTERNGGTISSFSAELGQGYPTANEVSIDRKQTEIPSWVGAGTLQPNVFTNTTTTDKIFIPAATNSITLKFNNITVDGRNYSTAPVTIHSTSFTKGYRYTVNATVKKENIPENITIKANPTSVTLLKNSGSVGYSTITTNDIGWTASIPAGSNWLELLNEEGTSGKKISFMSTSANTTTSIRSVVITVAAQRDPSKTARITVYQINNNSTGDIIIGTQLLSGPWGTALGLVDDYNNSTTSPWTKVYNYPGGIYNPVPDNDAATHKPFRGCKAYYELPDQSDKGKWRVSTWQEVRAIQSYYPNSYWGAESYANDGGTGGTGRVSSTMTGPAPYGNGSAMGTSIIWLGRGNTGNYRCVRAKN